MSILKQIIKRKTYEVDSAQKIESIAVGKNKANKLRLSERIPQGLLASEGVSLNKSIKLRLTTLQKATVKKAKFKKLNEILDKGTNQDLRNIDASMPEMESKVWGSKVNAALSVIKAQTFLKVKSGKNAEGVQKKKEKRGFRLEDSESIKRESDTASVGVKTGYNWVLNKVHPHHYSNILGYRYQNTIVNPNITLHGVRRVLHYLKKVIESYNVASKLQALPKAKSSEQSVSGATLIVVIESSILNAGSKEKAQVSSATLVAYSLLRLQQFSGLNVLPKTTKETIRYLTTADTTNLCGVLMLNPAKSVLGSLADTLFSKNLSNKLSAGNAIGNLCSKKGIPLISLCDISSPLTLCTYPIICDTRNVKSIYYVFDLLTYGLNQLTQASPDNKSYA